MEDSQPNSQRLLMFGRDAGLLDTRRLVLQTAGFAVEASQALPEIQAKLAADAAYGLLIVCHSVSDDDRRALAALAEKAGVTVYQIETLIMPTTLIAQASASKR